jgi:hypothetical protein
MMSWLINWGVGRYGAVSLDASEIRALMTRLALAVWRTSSI